MRLVTTAVMLALLTGAAAAAPRTKLCRQACGGLIAGCTTRTEDFGDLQRACKRAVLKRCRKAGTPICSTASTTGCALPATGQTTCWNNNGRVTPCAGTGQDGDTLAGAPLAYTDNEDGTVTDNNTGLIWEKQSLGDGSVHDDLNTYTWDSAFSAHVGTLNGANFAGHADWRMPNRKELESILNLENRSPAVSPAFNTGPPYPFPCTVLTCSRTQTGGYWSSTSYANDPGLVWAVDFDVGIVFLPPKTYHLYVRAVRGGS